MNDATSPKIETQWTDAQALELWKYFGEMGAKDKNTMVSVQSMLMPVQAAIVGYVALGLDKSDPRVALAAGLGLLISIVAAYVSLLYGGYSNRNWAYADNIAERMASAYPKFHELVDDNVQGVNRLAPKPGARHSLILGWRLARPCDPLSEMPRIFSLYAFLAIAAGSFDVVALVVSASKLWP